MNLRLLGAVFALLALTIDQASKKWLLFGYGIESRQPVRLGPYLDIILAWNRGVSYSLFTNTSANGPAILIGVTLAATLALAVWLWRARTVLTAVALGLLIGGALGNCYDRYAYGAVADFVRLHLGSVSWYIFNGADVAITVGVILLIWDSFFRQTPRRASKSP